MLASWRGMTLRNMDVTQLLNFVYMVHVQDKKEAEVEAFDAELNAPSAEEIAAAIAADTEVDPDAPPGWWGDGSIPGWGTEARIT